MEVETVGTPPQERVSAAVRREHILAAASRVFGQRGYVGATTDQVAKAAGISQPYVVRMFGSKENLFLEVESRALDKLMTAFRGVLADGDDDPENPLTRRLAAAYADLIADRGVLLSLMQGFLEGHDPVIGAAMRAGMLDLYRLLRDEAGMEPAAIIDFLGHGMLFNTLIAVGLVDEYDGGDPCVAELLEATFLTKLDLVLQSVADSPVPSAPAARAGA